MNICKILKTLLAQKCLVSTDIIPYLIGIECLLTYTECLLCGRHCSEKVKPIIFFSVTNMSVSLTAHFPALGIIIFINFASLMMKMIQFIITK